MIQSISYPRQAIFYLLCNTKNLLLIMIRFLKKNCSWGFKIIDVFLVVTIVIFLLCYRLLRRHCYKKGRDVKRRCIGSSFWFGWKDSERWCFGGCWQVYFYIHSLFTMHMCVYNWLISHSFSVRPVFVVQCQGPKNCSRKLFLNDITVELSLCIKWKTNSTMTTQLSGHLRTIFGNHLGVRIISRVCVCVCFAA